MVLSPRFLGTFRTTVLHIHTASASDKRKDDIQSAPEHNLVRVRVNVCASTTVTLADPGRLPAPTVPEKTVTSPVLHCWCRGLPGSARVTVVLALAHTLTCTDTRNNFAQFCHFLCVKFFSVEVYAPPPRHPAKIGGRPTSNPGPTRVRYSRNEGGDLAEAVVAVRVVVIW